MLSVRQTIILAAGAGTRLSGAELGIPKPLMTVAGTPLIAHALAHAHLSGCTEAIVVVGHEGARVRRSVEALETQLRVRFVRNPDPSTPNGDSLLVAEPFADDRFYLQMVDHLFAEPVLSRLAAAPLDPDLAGRVLVDRAPIEDLDLSDATKVCLAGPHVTAIGKGLARWDAIDAGCFVLTRRVFAALREVAGSEPRTVSSAMRQLARQHALGFIELGGVPWIDVDTPIDRQTAEQRFVAFT